MAGNDVKLNTPTEGQRCRFWHRDFPERAFTGTYKATDERGEGFYAKGNDVKLAEWRNVTKWEAI